MAQRKVTDIKTVPFRGGCNTSVEPALLENQYSMVQNFRQKHPGLVKRAGQAILHTTADGTNKVMSMYQFVKGKKTERHFFAQMSDSDVLEAYENPPCLTVELMTLDVAPATTWADGSTITGQTSLKTCVIVKNLTSTTYIVKDRSGTFTLGEVLTDGSVTADQGSTRPIFAGTVLGAEAFSGTASPLPASWANLNDFMLFCNGVDLPQIYPGTGNYVDKFYVYKGSFDPLTIANVYSGTDYSTEVSDGDSTTYADVSSLGTLAETLGDEIITNGTFDADTDWDKGTGWKISGNKANFDGTGGDFTISQTVAPTLTIGERYKYSAVVNVVDNGYYVKLKVAGVELGSRATAGSETLAGYWTATAATGTTGFTSNNTTAGVYADTFTLKLCNYDCVFIRTPIPVQELGFTVSSVNGSAAVAALKYWDGNSFEDVTGFLDGTIATAGKTLSGSGSMTWTAPTDEQASYLYGSVGYWYMVYLSSGSLDSETRVSAVTYESAWQSIKNIWDGVFVDVIEAQKYTSSTGAYTTYGASSITLDSMASTDALYFSSYDDIESINVSVTTPNATGDTLSLYRWNGTSWDSVSITDQTSGFSRSGRIIFARGTSKKQEFNLTGYMAHWYKITTGSSLAAAVVIALSVQPYFDITEIGKGQTVASWKNRAIYGTNQDHYCYVSALNTPQALNGEDSTIIEPGDGRYNRPVAMSNFKDDLMVWQEEKGNDGGCLTKFSWVSDVNDIKKTIISTTLGAMNSKSVDIVDGIEASELNRDLPVMTLAFCLSRNGVYITDGSVCYMIHKDIENYFDPTSTACIRRGYEAEMWLKYDSTYGVVRLGLVSGSSATLPNVFPVYDVKDKTWSFDSLAQELSCMTEVEGGSGAIPVSQVGGGIDDGFVYLLNYGTNDVSTAIDSYVTPEIDGKGEILSIKEILLRAKVQSAGNITVTPSRNSIADTAFTLSQTAETATQTIRRHRKAINLTGQHISFKIQHNTASESCHLLDMGLGMDAYTEQ